MFTVFKPKGSTKVKAVQVTLETVEDLAKLLNGRLTTETHAKEDYPEGGLPAGKITGFEYPTFDGVVKVLLSDYIVEQEVGGYKTVLAEEFEEAYEPARVTARVTATRLMI